MSATGSVRIFMCTLIITGSFFPTAWASNSNFLGRTDGRRSEGAHVALDLFPPVPLQALEEQTIAARTGETDHDRPPLHERGGDAEGQRHRVADPERRRYLEQHAARAQVQGLAGHRLPRVHGADLDLDAEARL